MMSAKKKKESPDIGQALTLFAVRCKKMKDALDRLTEMMEKEVKESKAFRKMIRHEMRK